MDPAPDHRLLGFPPGTRVLVSRRGHPWYGHSGVVEREPELAAITKTWMVRVRLDNGMCAGAFGGDLTGLERPAPKKRRKGER